MKKMEQSNMTGQFACAEGHTGDPLPRYILRVNFMDNTGTEFCTAFDQVAEKVLKTKCQDYRQLWEQKEEKGSAELDQIHKEAQFTFWEVTLKSKKETYQDTERIKFEVHRIEELFAGKRMESLHTLYKEDIANDIAASDAEIQQLKAQAAGAGFPSQAVA